MTVGEWWDIGGGIEKSSYDIFESALIRFKPTKHLEGKKNGEFHFLYQKIGFLELKNQMKWT